MAAAGEAEVVEDEVERDSLAVVVEMVAARRPSPSSLRLSANAAKAGLVSGITKGKNGFGVVWTASWSNWRAREVLLSWENGL